jgi:hypothetical protein
VGEEKIELPSNARTAGWSTRKRLSFERNLAVTFFAPPDVKKLERPLYFPIFSRWPH